MTQRLRAFRECARHPDTHLVLGIQHALWSAGSLRAAGAMDTVIAAHAIANDAVLIHYGHDFDHIGEATGGELKQRWIVPRGTA